MRTRRVEAYPIAGVAEEQVPNSAELGTFNGGREYIDGLLANVPFVYETTQKQQSIPFNGPQDEDDPVQLKQISYHHGRSFEVSDPAAPKMWQDAYGHTYTGLNLKGNCVEGPRIRIFANLPLGQDVHGLMDSTSIGRAMRVSRILRQTGVSTEIILGFAEPKAFPLNAEPGLDSHQNLRLQDFKSTLIDRHWSKLKQDKTFESLQKLHTTLDRVTFYVSARAMDTSIRLEDLDDQNCLEQVLDIANKYFKPDLAEPYTADPEGVLRLLNEVVVPKLAHNFFVMHTTETGIAHRYPGSLNLTALGSPVDLDSVHGQPLGLGDEPITIGDIYNDVVNVAYALSSTALTPLVRLNKNNQDQLQPRPNIPNEMFIDAYCQLLNDHDNTNGTDLYTQLRQYAVENKNKPIDNASPLSLLSVALGVDTIATAQRIINFADDVISSEEHDQIVGKINAWAVQQNPENITKLIIEKYGDQIINDVGHLIVCIFEAEMLEHKDNFMAKFDAGSFSEVSHSMVNEYMYDVMTEKIGSLYLEQYPEDTPKIASTDRIKDTIRFRDSALGALQDLYAPVMDEYMQKYADELFAITRYTVLDPIIDIPDNISEGFRTLGNIYAREYMFISNERLVEILTCLPSSTITYKHFQDVGYKYSPVAFADDPFTFETKEGYCLSAIMSGGLIEGMTMEFDDAGYALRNITIDKADIKSSNYVAFIQQTDTNTIVEVKLIDQQDVFPDLDNMTTEEVHTKLKYLYTEQGRLFDDSEFVSTRYEDHVGNFAVRIRPVL